MIQRDVGTYIKRTKQLREDKNLEKSSVPFPKNFPTTASLAHL